MLKFACWIHTACYSLNTESICPEALPRIFEVLLDKSEFKQNTIANPSKSQIMKRVLFFLSMLSAGFLLQGCESNDQDFATPETQFSELRQPATPLEEESLQAGSVSVVFWSRPNQRFTQMLITVDREDSRVTASGLITEPWYSDDVPDCSAHAGCASFVLPVGQYTYTASREDGDQITATFEVKSGECNQVYVYIPSQWKPQRVTAGN